MVENIEGLFDSEEFMIGTFDGYPVITDIILILIFIASTIKHN